MQIHCFIVLSEDRAIMRLIVNALFSWLSYLNNTPKCACFFIFVSKHFLLWDTHTHTHTHMLVVMVYGDFPYRRNGFYAVQTVCAIALHLNLVIHNLLLVIPVSYPCHHTNLCPHKPHTHTHTHTQKNKLRKSFSSMLSPPIKAMFSVLWYDIYCEKCYK